MGSTRGAAALLAAGILLLTAGCASKGTTTNPGAGVADCTPVAGGTCAPPDPQAGFDANHRYAQRVSPPATASATAKEVAAGLPALLDQIQAHPPVTQDSVKAVLWPAFPYPRYDAEVAAGTTEGPGIGFGIDVNGACVHGWVTATGRNIETGGLVRDGGCLAIQGH